MEISEFQSLIRELYFKKDNNRGISRTFIWLVEEIGELATLLKEENIDHRKVSEELADIIAWTSSLANLLNIDLDHALFKKYPNFCKKCGNKPCSCDEK